MYTQIEYMPRQHRASHTAARNHGVYPHNGAVREWVEGHPDDVIDSLDTDWASIVRSQAMSPDAEVLDDIPGDAMGGIGY